MAIFCDRCKGRIERLPIAGYKWVSHSCQRPHDALDDAELLVSPQHDADNVPGIWIWSGVLEGNLRDWLDDAFVGWSSAQIIRHIEN
jgi:hypothetical protein